MQKDEKKLEELKAIIARRNTALNMLLMKVKIIFELSVEIRESIVDELSKEFIEYGIEQGGEPNSYGLRIEELIDFCGLTKEL